jgi:DNA-binding transcriptional MerR regulator/Tfp pilus assembly protein PilF
VYALDDVARLFDLPESRLRYWSQTGFIAPTERRDGRGVYSFQDLISIKVAKGLLDAGLPLQRVRRSLDALRLNLPRVDAPLARLRIRCDHDRVLVDDDDGTFEAATGQLLLDFQVDSLREQAATVLALPWVQDAGREDPVNAYEAFLHARQLERAWDGKSTADPAFTRARAAYERTLELDPGFAAAWTNLGGLLAEAGDLDGARDAFDTALRCDPDQPEAQSNLAELALRDGDPELAISGFRQVLVTAPDYIDAHYGLARALLEVGGRGQALGHLERFCSGVERLAADERSPDLEHRRARAEQVIERLRRELSR